MKMYELADRLNIAPESLTRALQRNPQYTTLKAIADTLEVSVRDLFRGDDTQVSNSEMRGCIFFRGEMYTFNSREEIENFLTENK
jgi:transcriptional regulator with XRE-family HTH domain